MLVEVSQLGTLIFWGTLAVNLGPVEYVKYVYVCMYVSSYSIQLINIL